MQILCIFALPNKQKLKTMTNQITFQSEWKRRQDLIDNPKFRESCIEVAKKLGVTAEEWNANKVYFILYFANEMCARENKENIN